MQTGLTDLVVRAQRGDQAAFAALATGAWTRLNTLAHGILRDRELAEDATQQALLAAWRRLPQLRDADRFDAWTYRLLVNACYAEGRKARRWLPNVGTGAIDDPATPDGTGLVADRDQLERGFRRLSVDQRAVVVLHHYLDLTLEQVSETLGIPTGTVRSRLHRAMQGLRAALEADARPVTLETGTREVAP
jgi:RNA polymerase sigma-70 factor (ECF subfamily)